MKSIAILLVVITAAMATTAMVPIQLAHASADVIQRSAGVVVASSGQISSHDHTTCHRFTIC